MNKIAAAPGLLDLHNKLVKTNISSEEVLSFTADLWKFIEVNHRCNQMLWHEENLASRNDVEPREIMLNKN